jgi:hypothetical protein
VKNVKKQHLGIIVCPDIIDTIIAGVTYVSFLVCIADNLMAV